MVEAVAAPMVQPQLQVDLTGMEQTSPDMAPSFTDVLKGFVEDAGQIQTNADTAIKQLAIGEIDSIHDVVLKLEQADIAFKLMKEVRNKLLQAYQDITTMQ